MSSQWIDTLSTRVPLGATPRFASMSANLTARAGSHRFRPLGALRAHTKAPYRMDFHREMLRALNRPKAARTVVRARALDVRAAGVPRDAGGLAHHHADGLAVQDAHRARVRLPSKSSSLDGRQLEQNSLGAFGKLLSCGRERMMD